jgi:hypothetical protein
MIDMRDDCDIPDVHTDRLLVFCDATATTRRPKLNKRLSRGALPRRALSARLPAARRHG